MPALGARCSVDGECNAAGLAGLARPRRRADAAPVAQVSVTLAGAADKAAAKAAWERFAAAHPVADMGATDMSRFDAGFAELQLHPEMTVAAVTSVINGISGAATEAALPVSTLWLHQPPSWNYESPAAALRAAAGVDDGDEEEELLVTFAEGDTLASVADAAGTTVARLLELNGTRFEETHMVNLASIPADAAAAGTGAQPEWACAVCTFLNPPAEELEACDMCGMARPVADLAAPWTGMVLKVPPPPAEPKEAEPGDGDGDADGGAEGGAGGPGPEADDAVPYISAVPAYSALPSLSDYNMTPGCTVHLVLRLSGS